ncbi:FeoA domain protein [Cutibacterium acnes P07A]|nr:FeoA domain protein [Cutibacterium acnes P07A]
MVFHVCDVQMCLRRAQADMIMVRPAPQTAPQPAVEPCATTALA